MRTSLPALSGTRRALRLLPAVFLLAACDKPTDPEPRETAFTFTFRQGDTGAWQSFDARSLQPSGTSFSAPGPWVFAVTAGQSLILRPWQKAGENWQSVHVIVPMRPDADTIALGDADAQTCPSASGRPCTFWVFRTETSAGATVEVCPIVNGELVVTRRTPQWVSGEFSGTGVCRAGGTQRSFQVRDGAFDIGLPTPAAGPG